MIETSKFESLTPLEQGCCDVLVEVSREGCKWLTRKLADRGGSTLRW